MVCSVTRIVSMGTSSSFAVAWIFTAVSRETPRPSVMSERSLSGKGVWETSGVGTGDGVGFWDGTGSWDGIGSGATEGAGVSVETGVADGVDVSVGIGGSGVGVTAGVGVGSGVGCVFSVKVTRIVWALLIWGILYVFSGTSTASPSMVRDLREQPSAGKKVRSMSSTPYTWTLEFPSEETETRLVCIFVVPPPWVLTVTS